VCADLLAQIDLYLPTIANKLYGLSPTSGRGVQQPIAQLPSKNATTAIYTVYPKGSTLGYSQANPIVWIYSIFLLLLFLVYSRELFRKIWILIRNIRGHGTRQSSYTVLPDPAGTA
jgi:hypothetical protein